LRTDLVDIGSPGWALANGSYLLPLRGDSIQRSP
jgi:hypothetical protein